MWTCEYTEHVDAVVIIVFSYTTQQHVARARTPCQSLHNLQTSRLEVFSALFSSGQCDNIDEKRKHKLTVKVVIAMLKMWR